VGWLGLDELDKAILGVLGQGSVQTLIWPDFRLSARAVGKKLRVPSGTVRDRIARWTKSGFLKGPVLWLNPAIFDLHAGMLTFDASPTIPKRELIERLSMLDHIIAVNTHVGNWVGLGFVYASDESRKKKIELISKLCGAKNPKFARIVLGPPYRGKLSNTDWRIIERLQMNVVEPYIEIAGALRVSARTVRRRIKKMVSEGAIAAVPSTDVRGLENEILSYVMVEYKDPEKRAEVDEGLYAALSKYLGLSGLGDNYSIFLLSLPNIPSAKEVLERVKKVEGVRAARIEILEERVEFYDSYRENLDEKMRDVRPARVLYAR
jgi:DNA-binding Lrp family transcriptional regulator